MTTIRTVDQLIVWQKAHWLVINIYQLTDKFPSAERYGLISQIRRAAVSIASNIVEGFYRKSCKERLHFYNIAESSLEEVKYQLLIAKDLNYFSEDEYNKIIELAREVGKLLYGWMRVTK